MSAFIYILVVTEQRESRFLINTDLSSFRMCVFNYWEPLKNIWAEGLVNILSWMSVKIIYNYEKNSVIFFQHISLGNIQSHAIWFVNNYKSLKKKTSSVSYRVNAAYWRLERRHERVNFLRLATRMQSFTWVRQHLVSRAIKSPSHPCKAK